MIDYFTLNALRRNHPAWRLLCSEHVPLVVAFLHRVFVLPNVRVMPAADLAEALEDELYELRTRLGEEAFPRRGMDYLNEWADPEKGWLRKFYRQDSDEPQFDLTPATEKAIAWLSTLAERGFVGTESRLLTMFELLRQINAGSESDPEKRTAELQKRRDEIDAEIAQILRGDVPLLDDTALKDRFQQFLQLARELLADFREVEHNFRQLDRHVRERIALWEGAKGKLLEEIMGERDAIADSDQGRSFRAFWDFLMSSRRQEELTSLLDRVLSLAPVAELQPDARTRRVHYDWLEAGEHTQRTVAQLSQQLRRFLDDQAWLENRRIMDILHSIEIKALALRDNMPTTDFMAIDELAADIRLPMERPLYTPSLRPIIDSIVLQAGEENVDIEALYSQVVVDTAGLLAHISQALQDRSQVTLRELVQMQPLQHGLAELVAYLQLGSERIIASVPESARSEFRHAFRAVVDESVSDLIAWDLLTDENTILRRQTSLPRIIFVR